MKIAVVFSGCGYLDGAEINEVVATLWALSFHQESGAQVQCFAPDADQHHVVNHLTGEEKPGERRNILEESARIARGKVKPLSMLREGEFDALIMPGGFGAAKNLCTFAFEGSKGSVNPELLHLLKQFRQAEKPIGAACIAPAILALTFNDRSLELTVGESSDASREIEKLGHAHKSMSVQDAHIDQENLIVTTPAFMYDDAPLHAIFTGVKKMVDLVVALVEERSEAAA
ncbi:MAG TPA: isoprenoid biosynthesis glyoxalase ElbB [Candidatus Kapabacteria bacterium]|nr:isoprenoid biosynthesis glyoxalase ElbB [Candidatus Kapabacteria bacterium]